MGAHTSFYLLLDTDLYISTRIQKKTMEMISFVVYFFFCARSCVLCKVNIHMITLQLLVNHECWYPVRHNKTLNSILSFWPY